MSLHPSQKDGHQHLWDHGHKLKVNMVGRRGGYTGSFSPNCHSPKVLSPVLQRRLAHNKPRTLLQATKQASILESGPHSWSENRIPTHDDRSWSSDGTSRKKGLIILNTTHHSWPSSGSRLSVPEQR